MSRAGNRVSRRIIDGEIHYKIMTRGRREAQRLLEAGNVSLLYMESNKPRTARRKLAEILGDLSGVIRVCDPYYGIRTLDSLELFPEKCIVRFLTSKTNENVRHLLRAIHDFKRERPRTELRLYPNSGELHDRYILSRDEMLIVGHGLKDVGNKESFVIIIQRNLIQDLHVQVGNAFDDKWAKAKPM
jgi:hypothetical protein